MIGVIGKFCCVIVEVLVGMVQFGFVDYMFGVCVIGDYFIKVVGVYDEGCVGKVLVQECQIVLKLIVCYCLIVDFFEVMQQIVFVVCYDIVFECGDQFGFEYFVVDQMCVISGMCGVIGFFVMWVGDVQVLGGLKQYEQGIVVFVVNFGIWDGVQYVLQQGGIGLFIGDDEGVVEIQYLFV